MCAEVAGTGDSFRKGHFPARRSSQSTPPK